MHSILFPKRFAPLLLSGRKTCTLRNWKTSRVKAGEIAPTNLGIDLFIHDVKQIRIPQDITPELVTAEGYESRDALMAALREFNPTIPPVLTLIDFSVVETL